MSKGLIHIYTGDGKGKTTCAMGLAFRAAGHGKRVLILQFLKSRIKNTGEARSARDAGVEFLKFKNQTTPLFDKSVSLEELKSHIQKALVRSLKEIKSNLYDLIVMDEFNTLLSCNFITMKDAVKIVEAKPARLEMVFTGRGAPKELVRLADYVTEMRMLKHPYNNGVKARRGIEF